MSAVDLVRGHGVQGAGGEEGVEPEHLEQAGLVGVGRGVQVRDSAHDQAAGDLLGCLLRGERDVGDLGDLGDRDPCPGLRVADRVRVLDRGPLICGDRGDRCLDTGVLADRDADRSTGLDRGQDHGAAVVGRVRADQHHAGRPIRAEPGDRGQGVCGDPGRAAGRRGRALA